MAYGYQNTKHVAKPGALDMKFHLKSSKPLCRSHIYSSTQRRATYSTSDFVFLSGDILWLTQWLSGMRFDSKVNTFLFLSWWRSKNISRPRLYRIFYGVATTCTDPTSLLEILITARQWLQKKDCQQGDVSCSVRSFLLCGLGHVM